MLFHIPIPSLSSLPYLFNVANNLPAYYNLSDYTCDYWLIKLFALFQRALLCKSCDDAVQGNPVSRISVSTRKISLKIMNFIELVLVERLPQPVVHSPVMNKRPSQQMTTFQQP